LFQFANPVKFPAIARAQVLGESGGTVSEEAVRKQNRTIRLAFILSVATAWLPR
jgi:hypothetical protein